MLSPFQNGHKPFSLDSCSYFFLCRYIGYYAINNNFLNTTGQLLQIQFFFSPQYFFFLLCCWYFHFAKVQVLHIYCLSLISYSPSQNFLDLVYRKLYPHIQLSFHLHFRRLLLEFLFISFFLIFLKFLLEIKT